ncbi:hypothetical protein PAXRUDRAFT_683368 [Paxillus rubicundulus Ve08.2h10]|uniref:Uncharacterized protein n=1 Tax=Paxillus rubicundulus Ve08.2h10 TaxID=930991 RepID=A0A0D0EAT7_9AGAM|nr:hypothetical protein PAXRUDRAFT_683368 [Paxillus rubicundulus Ve08.2h10]
MSNLPPKPDFSRAPSVWPAPGEDRRLGGRSTPDWPSRQRDDRDAREHERGGRSYYPPGSPASSRDSYGANSRSAYHGRGYRGHDDSRHRDNLRKDWNRDRGSYRRPDDTWIPRKDYGADRASSSRRGYDGPHPRETEWRSRDDYRRERERGRSRERDYPYTDRKDREHDRRRSSPTYRPAPLSPCRDYHTGVHSPSRRPRPSYPPGGRRSSSPRSTGSRSRKSSTSPMTRVKPEVSDHHLPHENAPQQTSLSSPRKSSRFSRSASPRRPLSPKSSPTRSQVKPESPEAEARQHFHPDEPHGDDRPKLPKHEPAKGEDQLVVLENQIHAEPTAEPPFSKGKDRSDARDRDPHATKKQSTSPQQTPLSPLEHYQLQQLHQGAEAVPTPSTEPAKPAVTQPYLPIIPRYEAKPKFSLAYEAEFHRLDAHRAHAATEWRRCSKASRRALHELDMTTLDLRAAQHRRELAESHRKKAHHGQLGIDAETEQ